ncbi:MAG: sigma 54-interacting transcriptional regulator [Thermodesulfobacteriota bacterium]|nr:sigma 54-interacting transcriptional regulator [Thermodesulfobacteriota bacterium]
MSHQELNRYWKTVVETIQDGIMIVDTAGIILFVNRAFAKITGYSENEIIGKSCTLLNCKSCDISRQKGGRDWCVLFRQGKLNNMHSLLVRRDGTEVNIIKNASVLEGMDGKIMGAVETITDVTDLMEKDAEIEGFRKELEYRDSFHGIIGNSSAMQQVFNLITNAALSDAPVIIYGESGTGKEMVAKAIHEKSNHKNEPYIKVNCSALNDSLLESELFGHVKGAFTGALQNRQGKFEAAGKGDIFLDEIGDLSPATQVKLLRVLEEKVVEKVGDNHPVEIHARIITATNRDLQSLVDHGRFRADFYYRINVIPIFVPSLRDRVDDIPFLAESFFRRIQLKSGKHDIKGVSNHAFEILMAYPWPGNVRELKSAFEYAFVACQGKMIEPEHLPVNILNHGNSAANSSSGSRVVAARSMDEIKKIRLREALDQARGNKSEAARILGISRTSVWNQIKKYGIINYENS